MTDDKESVTKMMEKTSRAQALLAFYEKQKRSLPFRENPLPYYVWVSEIMLQQTRMETVLPYFRRFIEELPGLAALAAVDDDRLMKLWEGLGYYTRARNLKKAAGLIMEQYDGKMPGQYEELLKLPGIGPYTAGAIASIAFGEPVPAVDGNVIRVYSRLEAYGEDASSPAGKKFLRSCVERDLPLDRPGDFNQAVMELGATICLPNGAPLCTDCPVREDCRAFLEGAPMAFPVLPPRKDRRREDQTVLLVSCGNAFLAERRPGRGLLAGQNQFPMRPGKLERPQIEEWLRELGFSEWTLSEGQPAAHIFSHVEWHMQSWKVEVQSDRIREEEGSQSNSIPGSVPLTWRDATELDTMAFPSAFRSYRNSLKERFQNGAGKIGRL